MGIFSCLLGAACDDVHLMVMLGKRAAAEIKLEGKDIVVEVVNPIFAVEAVIEQLRKHDAANFEINSLKKQGYRILVRWSMIEVEL
ncbi:MAG: hypothetical protein ABIH90_01585 [Candidatus Aenigmatarchaeota archaeon]